MLNIKFCFKKLSIEIFAIVVKTKHKAV